MPQEKKVLYANIHANKYRTDNGSDEKMRKLWQRGYT